MLIKPVKNPRKENGDLGDIGCDVCGAHTGAYVKLIHLNNFVTVCKGCLLDWVAVIDKTILQDVVEKGRLKQLKK